MATQKGGAGDKKGKKPHKNKPTSQKYKFFNSSGSPVRKSRSCVKCGAGVFLAVHKDRLHCGKCGYTEFLKK